jgi:hypothetical protein
MAILLAVTSIVGCTTAPPKNLDNVCEIFEEKRGWYKDARKSSRRWGTSIPVMMSFIYQESAFKARARPPRTKILWVLPGPRPASAFGYAQATNETWAGYKKSTGSWGADRSDFDDAIDFIGWYNDQSHRRNKISKNDAYHLYLAYHEGQGGFAKKTFAKKKWLKDVARKLSDRADSYTQQLNGCEKKLDRGWLLRIFS